MDEHTLGHVEMVQQGSELPKEVQEETMSSDEELELALPAVSGVSTPEEVPPISTGLEAAQPSIIPSLAAQSQFTSSVPRPSPFRPPQNPAIPQDLAVIAELVNSYQAVGSLPPLTITAAEKRKQVEASIRARMEALQKDKGKAKVESEVSGISKSADQGNMDNVVVKTEEGSAEGIAQARTLEEDAALRLELDQFVGAPAVEDSDSSSDDSISSSEFESDSEKEEEENAEFVFSNSPAPSPRKRPMTFEVIDDDEEPVSSEPIMSVNEAPLPPVPQPPFERLPAGEGLTLAGEVVSWMKEKRVEAWWEAQNQAVAGPSGSTSAPVEEAIETPAKVELDMEEGEVDEMAEEAVTAPILKPVPATSTPKFSSSGTVVVRAMQQRPGQEGWLEEGSVVCHSDGSVLGFVSDTFGPLTSPFYSIRLPPPPFPLPSPTSVSIGTRLSYPLNPQYRSFVNMLAVRDPRFKGSDASNIHDEEVGEDEAEWSDDEMEAEAKKRKKNKRSDSRVSKTGRSQDTGYPITNHSLPNRPHFDYVPEDASDAASFYGENDGDDNEGDMVSVSDAGSSASRRPMPMPYDLDEGEGGGAFTSAVTVGGEGGNDGGKRGRGQGRQRGGGRGGGGRGKSDSGGRGGRNGGNRDSESSRGNRGKGRGGGRGGNNQLHTQNNHNPSPIRPTFGLPQRPQFDALSSLPTPPPSAQSIPIPANMAPNNPLRNQHVDGYRPPQKNQSQNTLPTPPPRPPQQQQQFNTPNPQYAPYQQQFNPYPSPSPQHQQTFQQPQQHQFPYPHQQQQQQQQYPSYDGQMQNMGGGQMGGNGPAINPRFAAQYQQMQFMSHLAAWQGQGQGQGDGNGGGGDQSQGGYGPPGGYSD